MPEEEFLTDVANELKLKFAKPRVPAQEVVMIGEGRVEATLYVEFSLVELSDIDI